MSDSWDNEINTKLTKVTPISLYVPRIGIKIFLAGSVCGGNAPRWQDSIFNYIEKSWLDTDITVYNPRREDFTTEMENEQAAWTMSMISSADFILLHLVGDTGSPISTFELGLFVNDPRLYFSVDESYSRKEVIEYHYNYFGFRQIHNTPNESIDAMRADWYKERYIK